MIITLTGVSRHRAEGSTKKINLVGRIGDLLQLLEDEFEAFKAGNTIESVDWGDEHPDFDIDPDWDEVKEYFRLYDLHDHDALKAFFEMHGSFEYFEESFQGIHEGECEFAEQLVDDLYDPDDTIKNYFNYVKFARDLFIQDYWFDEDSGAVFRNV